MVVDQLQDDDGAMLLMDKIKQLEAEMERLEEELGTEKMLRETQEKVIVESRSVAKRIWNTMVPPARKGLQDTLEIVQWHPWLEGD